jgi:hypothetical protein
MYPDVHRRLATMLAASFLTGCSSGPTINSYHAPGPSQPSADLIILPANDVLQRNESERLDVRDTQCSPNGEPISETMNLAKWYRSGEVKPVQVALPAGRAYLRYEKDENRQSCAISFSAKLEAGHTYALQAEKKYMGWLKGSSCLVSLIDMSANSPVSLDYESANAVYQSSCKTTAQR